MINDPALTTDRALLRLYAKGRDPEAFAELIKRHAGLVYGTCKRVLGNDDDAQDVSQECFLELARKAGSVRSSLPAYLHHMARNRSIDAIRKASARRRTEQEAAMLTDNSSERTWADIAPLVDEALARLPDRLRVPIILHYLEGRTQGQIAQELGLSQSTVSRNLDKGVSSLREALRKAGVIVSVAALAGLLTENAATAAPGALMAALGKMGVAGVGGASFATGVTALLGTFAGKCMVALIAVGIMAGVAVTAKLSLDKNSDAHSFVAYSAEAGKAKLPAILEACRKAASSIKSGKGSVTLTQQNTDSNGKVTEDSTTACEIAFRGDAFRLERTLSSANLAKPQKETVACDGHSVRILYPDIMGILSNSSTGEGRQERLSYDLEIAIGSNTANKTLSNGVCDLEAFYKSLLFPGTQGVGADSYW